MVERESWHDGFRAKLKVVAAEREAAEDKFNRLRGLQEAMEAVLRLIRDDGQVSYADIDLGDLSVNKGLVEIAKRNNGIVVTREAISAYVDAGVHESRDDANSSIHSSIRRSKEFERIEPGVYKYVGSNGMPKRAAEVPKARSRTPSGLGKLVQNLIHEHPSWGHAEVLAELQRRNHDFGGKNANLAVSMSISRLRRKRKQDGIPQLSLVAG